MNKDIRIALITHNIKQLDLAVGLKTTPVTVCRWLKQELPEDKKVRILATIEKIVAERGAGI